MNRRNFIKSIGALAALATGVVSAKSKPDFNDYLGEGSVIKFTPSYTNTGPATLNIDGMGAKTVEPVTSFKDGDTGWFVNSSGDKIAFVVNGGI